MFVSNMALQYWLLLLNHQVSNIIFRYLANINKDNIGPYPIIQSNNRQSHPNRSATEGPHSGEAVLMITVTLGQDKYASIWSHLPTYHYQLRCIKRAYNS